MPCLLETWRPRSKVLRSLYIAIFPAIHHHMSFYSWTFSVSIFPCHFFWTFCVNICKVQNCLEELSARPGKKKRNDRGKEDADHNESRSWPDLPSPVVISIGKQLNNLKHWWHLQGHFLAWQFPIMKAAAQSTCWASRCANGISLRAQRTLWILR